jgi:hypothetical protein
MPEFSSEVAGTVSRASVMEIEGLGSGATRTVCNLPSIPVANVLVKTRGVPKHPRHILYIANIPAANVFVKVFVVVNHL